MTGRIVLTKGAWQNASALRHAGKSIEEENKTWMGPLPHMMASDNRRAKKRGGGKEKCICSNSLLWVWGHSAGRAGPWPAAHATRAMKAGCKQPAQMAFEGCAAVRSRL